MPMMKCIACHTSSSRTSVLYVAGKDNGKVVARDYFNCAERDDFGREVWEQFDLKRAKYGMDKPRWRIRTDYEGNPVLDGDGNPVKYDSTVYYVHFVLSPDPKDNPTLEQVRQVAREWVGEHFPDFQVVVGYHDDTGILHAHVLVNVPNLSDGSRVKDVTRRAGWARGAWSDLQRIARSHGLSGFCNENDGRQRGQGGDAGAGLRADGACAVDGRAVQPARADERSKAVASLYTSGRYSWVEDVRSRLEVAALISGSVEQYREECARLGIEVSRTADGRDWKYAMASKPSRQISGRKLGSAWTEFGVGRRLAHERAVGTPKPTGESLAALEAALETLVEAGARRLGIVCGIERRRLEEDGWRFVRGVRLLLRGATGQRGAEQLGDMTSRSPLAAGALSALQGAGWPVEGKAPFGALSNAPQTAAARPDFGRMTATKRDVPSIAPSQEKTAGERSANNDAGRSL